MCQLWHAKVVRFRPHSRDWPGVRGQSRLGLQRYLTHSAASNDSRLASSVICDQWLATISPSARHYIQVFELSTNNSFQNFSNYAKWSILILILSDCWFSAKILLIVFDTVKLVILIKIMQILKNSSTFNLLWLILFLNRWCCWSLGTLRLSESGLQFDSIERFWETPFTSLLRIVEQSCRASNQLLLA